MCALLSAVLVIFAWPCIVDCRNYNAGKCSVVRRECDPCADLQDTLTYLLDHLKRVAARADVNKMTSLNLAVCFGPALVCPSPHGDVDLQPTDKLDKHVDLLKYLLDIWPETRGTCRLRGWPS